jgi:lipid A 4'-phosphatase
MYSTPGFQIFPPSPRDGENGGLFQVSVLVCLLERRTSGSAVWIEPQEGSMKRIVVLEFLAPVLFLLLATLFFRLTDADILIAGLFYSPSKGWFLENLWVVEILHRFSSVPAILVSAVAAGLLVHRFFSKKAVRRQESALYCFLVFMVGVVLIVNLVFKDQWGRPRPNQTQPFGGPKQYLAIWEKGDCRECRSFPCGDASAGFFFIFPYFILRPKSPRRALFYLLLGLGFGSVFGLCRMARGAHFASDVIWSGGFMYLTCVTFYYALRMHVPEGTRRPPQPFAVNARPQMIPQTGRDIPPFELVEESGTQRRPPVPAVECDQLSRSAPLCSRQREP